MDTRSTTGQSGGYLADTESARRAAVADLWRRSKEGDAAARAALVEQYRPFVAWVVNRMTVPRSAVVDREDLMSAGFLGLLNAMAHYEPSRDVPFQAYAGARVRGAVIDQIRRLDSYGRSVWRHVRELRAAVDTITSRTGREPRLEELRKATELGGDRLRLALQAHGRGTLSLDRLAADGLEPSDGEADADPMQPILERDLIDDLRHAMNSLPEREHRILTHIYDEALTLQEIGQRLGVSESRVCQLHARAIARLRTALGLPAVSHPPASSPASAA